MFILQASFVGIVSALFPAICNSAEFSMYGQSCDIDCKQFLCQASGKYCDEANLFLAASPVEGCHGDAPSLKPVI